MIIFGKGHLFFKDYTWTSIATKDNRISGKLDDTEFNREEGQEVLYVINSLMKLWDYRFINTAVKMEKLIRKSLPSDIKNQEEVRDWMKNNLSFNPSV